MVIEQGRIAYAGPTPAEESSRECQEVAVLPAFVNAHTHLEFSSLDQPLGEPGLPFTQWIARVIAWKRERDMDEASGAFRRQQALRRGIDESRNGGANCLGEIATTVSSQDELNPSSLMGVVFWEFMGLSRDRLAGLREQAWRFLGAASARPEAWQRGLSPHAPYTVHPDLLVALSQISVEKRVPVAMHLAETQEELQLLRDGTGPFVELLTQLNAWFPSALPRGARPLHYLQMLARAHRGLVIHGNYLDDEERSYVAGQRDRLAVVYCPRTHAYFGHDPYPLRDLLDRGARVALGTDSRASNPDLSMRNELRFAAAQHPRVAPNELLRMATIEGAWALGLADELGSLRPGKRALLQAIPLPPDGTHDPFSWL